MTLEPQQNVINAQAFTEYLLELRKEEAKKKATGKQTMEDRSAECSGPLCTFSATEGTEWARSLLPALPRLALASVRGRAT